MKHSDRRRVGNSAPGSALRRLPRAILYHPTVLQGENGGAHNSHCATLHAGRHHDGRLKSLGKIQRAPLGTFNRAPTACRCFVVLGWLGYFSVHSALASLAAKGWWSANADTRLMFANGLVCATERTAM